MRVYPIGAITRGQKGEELAEFGDLKDAVVILAVVLFNAVLGFWQEHRAEATLAALKKMLSPVARVKRGGQVEELAAAQLVPGDLVMLEAANINVRRANTVLFFSVNGQNAQHRMEQFVVRPGSTARSSGWSGSARKPAR